MEAIYQAKINGRKVVGIKLAKSLARNPDLKVLRDIDTEKEIREGRTLLGYFQYTSTGCEVRVFGEGHFEYPTALVIDGTEDKVRKTKSGLLTAIGGLTLE